MGQPPANERDRLIIKGFLRGQGFPPNVTGARGIRIGPVPNPKLTDSTSSTIVASSSVCIAVVLIITGIRIAGKFSSKKSRLGWDDWFMILATLSFCAYAGLWIAQAYPGGIGQHRYNIRYSTLEKRVGPASATWFFIFFVIVPTKLSIICFNARLTGLTSNFWRWTHRLLFVLICAFGLFFIPWYICVTDPISARFSYIAAGKAKSFSFRHRSANDNGADVARTVYVAIHIATDWILLGIPIWIVTRLQMPLGKKLRCIIPISVGCLSAIGAVCSNYYRTSFPFKDPNYNQDKYVHWRYADLVCGIIATSLPAVAAVLGANVKLPQSLSRYFSSASSSRQTPLVYETKTSNPFSSEKSQTTSQSARTVRDKYDEFGGVNGDKENIDLDDTHGVPWTTGDHHVSNDGSQTRLQEKPEMEQTIGHAR